MCLHGFVGQKPKPTNQFAPLLVQHSLSNGPGTIPNVPYTTPLGDILREHGVKYHLYADDTQMYLFFESTSSEHRDRWVETIQSCVNDISKWMRANKLKLNKDKTELIVISSQHRPRPHAAGYFNIWI